MGVPGLVVVLGVHHDPDAQAGAGPGDFHGADLDVSLPDLLRVGEEKKEERCPAESGWHTGDGSPGPSADGQGGVNERGSLT